jgi:hypothetical protein
VAARSTSSSPRAAANSVQFTKLQLSAVRRHEVVADDQSSTILGCYGFQPRSRRVRALKVGSSTDASSSSNPSCSPACRLATDWVVANNGGLPFLACDLDETRHEAVVIGQPMDGGCQPDDRRP